jgi:hypothetical protein
VGIAAGARGQVVVGREPDRPLVEVLQRRLGVAHLDRVDETVAHQPEQDVLAQAGAHGIEWVRDVDDAALGGDRHAHLLRSQARRHPLGEEQPDDLPHSGPHLLADHDAAAKA